MNIFETTVRIANFAGKVFKWIVAALFWVALFGVVTATSIFGFYFIGSGVMALFTVLASIAVIAAVLYIVGFAWKVLRLFFPKIEPVAEPVKQ